MHTWCWLGDGACVVMIGVQCGINVWVNINQHETCTAASMNDLNAQVRKNDDGQYVGESVDGEKLCRTDRSDAKGR